MHRMTKWIATVALCLMLPLAAGAQVVSLKEAQISGLETMKGKFAGLADAFPEDSYDWRPMEGVRSVKEVLSLIVAECHLFPTMWGTMAPEGANGDFRAELARVGAMSKGDLIEELNSAFDHIIGVLDAMDDDARMAPSNFFGTQVTTDSGIMMAMGDMHEHLGQLIAYARSNEIVPPWSR